MTERNTGDDGRHDGNGRAEDRNGGSARQWGSPGGPPRWSPAGSPDRYGEEGGGERAGERSEDHGRSRSWIHDDPPPQQPAQRTGSRHWMHDTEPPRMDFRSGERSATRPRDFRDYGRGDYRGNVGPGGYGYAESNYGPTRYREAYGRTGRETESPYSEEGDRERRSFAGRGPRNYRRSDERVRELICERLTEDPYVDASDVTVEVKDGVVTLGGTVPERHMKYRIEDIAADVARDDDVRNEVRVAAGGSGGGRDR